MVLMENIPRRDLPPDDAMRGRVRKAGVAGVAAFTVLGGVGVGQAARVEKELTDSGVESTSAQDVHSQRDLLGETAEIVAQPIQDKELSAHLEKEVTAEYQEPAAWWPAGVKQNWLAIQKTANEYQLNPYLVATIVAEESMGQNVQNQSGATGVMQIMPSTAQEVARLRHRAYYNMNDTTQNLDYGCWLIHYLDEKYISGQGVDLESDMGIAMLAVYYGDGEGAGEMWVKNGYSKSLLSAQAKHVTPLWTAMYHGRDQAHSAVFEKIRGK